MVLHDLGPGRAVSDRTKIRWIRAKKNFREDAAPPVLRIRCRQAPLPTLIGMGVWRMPGLKACSTLTIDGLVVSGKVR